MQVLFKSLLVTILRTRLVIHFLHPVLNFPLSPYNLGFMYLVNPSHPIIQATSKTITTYNLLTVGDQPSLKQYRPSVQAMMQKHIKPPLLGND